MQNKSRASLVSLDGHRLTHTVFLFVTFDPKEYNYDH